MILQKCVDNAQIILYTVYKLADTLYMMYREEAGYIMETLGERLNYARKSSGYTQNGLAESIGVSRGVIFNLEKNKTVPQAIVINAICQTLNVNSDWLLSGVGEMKKEKDPVRSDKVLRELYEFARELSEDEQLYLLDAAKALKHRLNRN